MGNHHDSIALDWVRGEIQDTLTQSQQALETFVDNRDDKARLRFCLNYLHQVHGTLQMVELYGAAVLTEEMEKLTQSVLNETVANADDAVEVLMQGILQLPQYLEQLTSNKDDFPLVLLPLLNDLRAARGEALLSDTSLFRPDLSRARKAAPANVSQRLQDPKVLGHIRKLRQMFQFALAGVVREVDLDAHFDYMQKVIDRLIRLCRNTPHGELWKAAGGFVETLQERVNPVNLAVKSLLRELDADIRRLTDEHVDILQQPVPEALLKHLLYYVARGRDLDTGRVKALRDAYQLSHALPSDDDVNVAQKRASGPGRDAIHSVVGALNEELAKLKDQLDLFVRSDTRQNNELDDLLPGLGQIANTLAILDLGIPRKVVTEQMELVEKLSSQQDAADDGTLMDIAGALLYVESSLADLDSDRSPDSKQIGNNSGTVNPGSRELGEASGALLRESRNALEQVKSAIVNFIASQWEDREIEHVPGLLHSIRGGLALIPLDRVADMLASAERYVADVLLDGKQIPDWSQLDTLADIITSIEYYLERLADGIGDNESVLSLAESSLRELGFPVGEEPTWEHPSDIEELPTISAEAPIETGSVAAKASDNELLDDEILGVFTEEAEEVLETINEFFPRLRQSSDDREALTEVRRAFHTLKGSGRMVGASSIGELAWSVENLLNRVIDKTLKPTDEMFNLIDQVHCRIPSLIEEFRDGESAGDVQPLIARADTLSTTRKTDTPGSTAQTAIEKAPEPVTNAEDDLIDDNILEIFSEEAGEVLETLREYLPALLQHHQDHTALSELRRAFHTLKGSGRMVGALVVGELSWSVENLLNRVIDGTISMNEEIAILLDDVSTELPGLIGDFENQRPPSKTTAALEAKAHALADGEIPDTGGTAKAETGEPVDPLLLEIFESETQAHLQTLKDFLNATGDKSSVAYTDDLSRALHTLKGSAQTAGIGPIARVITPLERFIKEARAQNHRADRAVIHLVEQACSFLTQGLGQIAENPQSELPGTDVFLQQLEELSNARLQADASELDEGPARTSPQLVQLFLSEGLDILLDADRILDEWATQPDKTQSRDILKEELSGLTDGASEAQLTDVAELSRTLSQTYERTASTALPPDKDYFFIVRAAHEHLINMMDQVAAGLATEPSKSLIEDLESLATAQPAPAEPQNDAPPLPETDEETDNELAVIFLEEARDLVDSTADSLQSWSENTGDTELLHLLQRNLHTLKGGARLVAISPIGDLSHELENLFEGLDENRLPVTDSLSDLFFRCHDRLAGMVDALEQQEPLRPAPDLISEIRAYMDSATGSGRPSDSADPQQSESPAGAMAETSADNRVGIFLDEGLEIHGAIGECLAQWRDEPDELQGVTQLQQELLTLRGGARLSDLDPVAELAEAWSDALDQLIAGASNQNALLQLSEKAQTALRVMLASLEEGETPVRNIELTNAFNRTHKSDETADTSTPKQPDESESVDAEVLELFLEEAVGILDQLDQLLSNWHKDLSNSHFNLESQRALHTLKGGARLSQLFALGNKAHQMETRLIDLGGNKPDEDGWETIKADYEGIIDLVDDIRQRFESTGTVPPLADVKTATPPEPAAKKAPAKGRGAQASAQRTPQETIRVSAPLLDEMVNLAGETSITRARLEQQTSDFSHNLDEMTVTIERLREQLRRMEIETETQILFRAEKEHGPDYGDDFDPLEMDRYSAIQQLSRALTESTSDLADLRETLSDRVRDTETLLVQQSRINTELQEGLMKTRMIPFASMVPRLRRIVRQISGELEKKVEFDVRNPEGEMDRNILERMVAPLEHMLRNALDHGIEKAVDRRKNGKPETGEVTLSLTREGGDVVLRMIDDGAGIPANVVRDKAIRQGMLDKNEKLSEREILQFILLPGFSTAQQVTQISGRGVGMDVVASEIKQLGGSLDIDSTIGKGTVFTVRLPFTVSVNRALMVSTGEDFYAIPLNTIEGIVRVSTYELEEYYKPEAPLYEYAGRSYRLQYLGSLLNSDHHPKLQGQALPLPVILVRGAEQPMALQVDSLKGSREIVVKSLGPQFAAVRGVSGATILGDGNVVVILDLPAMIRSDILSERQRLASLEDAKEANRKASQVTTVMVVDDSVTVRKVTSRLLERNGMEVVTARDGVDAIAQLQGQRPDIILLDIEMPRMDGFEVAGFIRHDDALRYTPICMITSRTGEKHRERALAIGVNDYLGKPFQETDLLETIKRLTGAQG